jgi:hypothetical protein
MDLICYTQPGWEPRIRPASPKRDWMEASPERFAYRCLPLAIANAHGWEMLSPCGFEARWNGGPRVEDVEVRLDPGTNLQRAPVALFGQGVITFHIEGILRTPEGWNLWVGGPPNGAKDGIAPLGGVIETDWSPYTFTMNWRFTRADHWIRFEENEPFCFFFPIERGRLAVVEPQIRPLSGEPGLKEAFETWSKSRNAFQQWVRDTNPKAPADKWQKLYYRGVRPDGGEGPADHEAKLRLDQFRLPNGSALETGSCPAHKPAPAPPAILAAAPARPARVDDLSLNLALRRIGFDAAPNVAKAELAPTAAPPSDVPLRRREWLLDTIERQRALSARTGGVPRVRDLSSEDFLDLFYAPGRPVVIEGEIDDWPALTRWTPDYLRAAVGDAPVECQAGRDANPDFELDKDRHRRILPFATFLDLIEAGGNDAYITAYNSAGNAAALAPLQRDLGFLEKYLTRAHGMMWIGPAGTFTPLHFDLTNNLLAQIVGRKRVTLLPPSEAPRLQHNRHVFSDVHDIHDESRLAKYPAARDARRFEVDLGPGDLLYVPIGWWHQVRSLDFSAMLTYTNFLWPNEGHETYPRDAG